MWFNIAGAIVKWDKEKVLDTFGIEAKDITESYLLECATQSENFEKFHIGQKNNVTLIVDPFLSSEVSLLARCFPQWDVLAFIISDTTCSYFLALLKDGKKIKEFSYIEWEVTSNFGSMIEYSQDEDGFVDIDSDTLCWYIEEFSGIWLLSDDLFEMEMDIYNFDGVPQEKNTQLKKEVKKEKSFFQEVWKITLFLLEIKAIFFLVTILNVAFYSTYPSPVLLWIINGVTTIFLFFRIKRLSGIKKYVYVVFIMFLVFVLLHL